VGDDRAFRRANDPANHADERRLSRAVRAEEREDFATANFEIDLLESLEAGRVRLAELPDSDDGLHAPHESMAARELSEAVSRCKVRAPWQRKRSSRGLFGCLRSVT